MGMPWDPAPAAPFVDPEIVAALSTLCAILSVKIVVTHILTARARVMSKTFDEWGNGGRDMAVTTGECREGRDTPSYLRCSHVTATAAPSHGYQVCSR